MSIIYKTSSVSAIDKKASLSANGGNSDKAKLIFHWRVVLLITFCASALVLCASLAQDMILYRAAEPDLSSKIWLLDVDVEKSVMTWISVLALFMAAFLLFQVGNDATARGSAFRWHWYLLGAIFVVLSLDDFASFHEKVSEILGERVGGSGLTYFAWALPAGVLSLAGLLAFVPFLRSLPPAIAGMFIASAGLFLGGAVGMEMIGGMIAEADGVTSLRYRIATNVEEGLEIIGVLLFLYALLRLREQRQRRV